VKGILIETKRFFDNIEECYIIKTCQIPSS